MTVVPLPGCSVSTGTAPPHLPLNAASPFNFAPRRASEIGLAGIAVKLGMADRPRRAIIDHIRKLIDGCGFPAPKTPRFRGDQRLTGGQAVHAKSVWDRDQVDDWFDGDLPPAAAAAASGAERERVRQRLAERASQLAGWRP